ncbi:hypothetical protein BH09BAC5_BH09BAC5_25600 [soil metagenome]
MQTIRAAVRHCRYFLIPYGIFLVISGIVLLLFSKETIHITINHVYCKFGDLVMPYITLSADGFTITILVLLLFAYNRKFAFWTGISCLLASFITQILKHTVFEGDPRPKLFFQSPSPLRFVPGIENYLIDTFPSGHTTVAFAFYFSLVFAVKNNYLKAGLFLIALLIGYSRIYLSQHFLGDVFGGSIIGTICTFSILTFVLHKNWVQLSNFKK